MCHGEGDEWKRLQSLLPLHQHDSKYASRKLVMVITIMLYYSPAGKRIRAAFRQALGQKMTIGALDFTVLHFLLCECRKAMVQQWKGGLYEKADVATWSKENKVVVASDW